MNAFTTLIAAVAVAAAGAAVPAAAQTPGTIRVATHDLDLSNVRDQRVLDRRIARAAQQLCDTANPRFGANVRVSQRQCREAAIASARDAGSRATRIAVR